MTQREVFIDWLEGITRWTTKLDMTFSWNCDEFRARKLFTRWMQKELPSSTFIFAIERDPNQDKVMNTKQGFNQACHVHAISDTDWDILLEKQGIRRRDKWQNWKNRYGLNRIDPVRTVSAATGYALKKILNYSDNRQDFGSHCRKTDVDWDLVFGKGRRATERRDEARLRGQEFMALGHTEFARRKTGHKNHGMKQTKVNGGLVHKQEDLFPWQMLGRKET